MTSKTQNVREQRKEMEIIQDCLNLNDYQLKISNYRPSFMNPKIHTNQKPTTDLQELKKKEYNHITKKRQPQGKKQKEYMKNYKNNRKASNKMALII